MPAKKHVQLLSSGNGLLLNSQRTGNKKNIANLEFYPIVVAVQMFGIKLANKHINFHCDNKAVVQVINKQSCKDPKLMKLTRHLVLTSMQYNIKFSASHIPGEINHLPDALSRLQMIGTFETIRNGRKPNHSTVCCRRTSVQSEKYSAGKP